MKVIIPMAGIGARFIAAGYKDPKPLIRVNGKRIIEYILEMFYEEDIVFICNEEHLEKTQIFTILKELKPKCEIISMPNHKLGPVYTVKQAFEFIDDEEEVIVSYCDNPYIWDREDFKNNLTYNGEFYVTLVYNLLIADGLKVGYYDTPFATVMGTPEEVENFESWANIMNKGQVKSEEDLLNCYRYWKKYHENNLR